jgi:hypothetical protein
MSREEQIIAAYTNAIQPVLENAVVVAAEYCKATGRSIVTALDMEYGMKWSAMKLTGRVYGSILPDADDEDSDGWETDDDMVVQECDMGFDDEFREYDGDKARKGKLILFPPYWTHEHEGVIPRSGDKYIVTGWLCYNRNVKEEQPNVV